MDGFREGCRHRACQHCHRRCLGTVTKKYRVYENCCYEVYPVCSGCGREYEHHHHPCPHCGGHHEGWSWHGHDGHGRREEEEEYY